MTATCARCERGHNLPKRGTIAPERCPRCLDAALHAANAELARLRAMEARLADSLANAKRAAEIRAERVGKGVTGEPLRWLSVDDVRRALEYVRGDKA